MPHFSALLVPSQKFCRFIHDVVKQISSIQRRMLEKILDNERLLEHLDLRSHEGAV